MVLCKANGGACDRETSHQSGLCNEHRPIRDVKTDKKNATKAALLEGWRADLFVALADCDAVVPRNAIVSLQAKHPGAGIREGETYKRLFAHMEGEEEEGEI
jgi:hypothetical protein